MSVTRPRWIRDLLRFLPLRSQFVLSGNVRDQYPCELAPELVAPLPLIHCLVAEMRALGFKHFIAFDPSQGFTIPLVLGVDQVVEREFFASLLGLTWQQNGQAPASLDRFFELAEIVVRHGEEPIAIFADFASRFLVRPDIPNEI